MKWLAQIMMERKKREETKQNKERDFHDTSKF